MTKRGWLFSADVFSTLQQLDQLITPHPTLQHPCPHPHPGQNVGKRAYDYFKFNLI